MLDHRARRGIDEFNPDPQEQWVSFGQQLLEELSLDAIDRASSILRPEMMAARQPGSFVAVAQRFEADGDFAAAEKTYRDTIADGSLIAYGLLCPLLHGQGRTVEAIQARWDAVQAGHPNAYGQLAEDLHELGHRQLSRDLHRLGLVVGTSDVQTQSWRPGPR